MSEGETADMFREVTESEMNQIKNRCANLIAKGNGYRTVFTPYYEACGAVFSDKRGYYSLNGIDDLTEQDMIEVEKLSKTMFCGDKAPLWSAGSLTARTNFPTKTYNHYYTPVNFSHTHFGPSLEVLNLESANKEFPFSATQLHFFMQSSSRCHTILGTLDLSKMTDPPRIFTDSSHRIANFTFSNLKVNLTIEHAKFVTLDSLRFLVNNAANTDPISIKVHPEVFAKLTSEDAALAEWSALRESAAVKNISFISE